jgi:hypothetical protein
MTIIYTQSFEYPPIYTSPPDPEVFTLPLGFTYTINTYGPQPDAFAVPVGELVDAIFLNVFGSPLSALPGGGGSIHIGSYTESFTVTNGLATYDDGFANAFLDAGTYNIINQPSFADPGTQFYQVAFDVVRVTEPGSAFLFLAGLLAFCVFRFRRAT